MEIISHAIMPFRRFGVAIQESLWIDGEPYFTMEAIAKWLGFKDVRSVKRIIRKNNYIMDFSKKVKVLTSEKYGENKKIGGTNSAPSISRKMKREISVLDLMGMQQVVMLASTKRGNEFRIAASKLITAFMRGKLVPRSPMEQEAEKVLERWRVVPRDMSSEKVKQYGALTGLSRSTAYRHLQKYRTGDSPYDRKWCNATPPVVRGDLELKIRQMVMEDPRLPVKIIWQRLGSPKSPSYCTVRKYATIYRNEIRQAIEHSGEGEISPAPAEVLSESERRAIELNRRTQELAAEAAGILAELESIKKEGE